MKLPRCSLPTLLVLVTLLGIACAAVAVWPMLGMIELASMFLVMVSLPVLALADDTDWLVAIRDWRDWWRKK